MIRRFSLLLALAAGLDAAPLELRLPTENSYLFSGEPEKFYMYVDRNFEGQITKPWQAGSFGFVRTALRINGEVIQTKFHEGIDISPIKRDKAGNPLDLVSSIAAGRVVHVSLLAGRSNYGKYVVVEHRWENSSVYSLYAHLAEITCKPGDPVNCGSMLGRMGFTGAGIDRTRAHCHLEVVMLMSQRYEEFNRPDPVSGIGNTQGLFNGMNLSGCDAARFFLEQKANPNLQFSQFITTTPAYFKVAVPLTETPDFAKRYPWIIRENGLNSGCWEISFTATGLPVSFSRCNRTVTEPTLTAVRPSTIPQRYLTRGLITGEGNQAALSNGGKQLVALLTDSFPAAK
jgi:murein DD-endopeptidase MepM/ murein hydrolase activator NlpD